MMETPVMPVSSSAGVLVTGASGFIASHVVLQLLQSGYKVKGSVRSLHNESKVKHLKNLCTDSTYPLELVEADLSNEQSWISAVKDCDFVLHLASPFPVDNPKDENVLIIPAVEGTQNVLKACALSSTVKRVVLTSSIASICDFSKDFEGDANESNWPDVDSLDAYSKSKMLAEKEAWNFMDNMGTSGKKSFDLVVINPGYVLGPVLSGSSCASMEIIKRIMCRDPPLIPKMNFSVVDVRDVASAHIAAMKLPEANGRYITTAGNMWMKDMAAALHEEFREQGYRPSGMEVPHFLFKLVALFDTGAKRVAPFWGKKIVFNNSKMRCDLKIEPRPLKQTVVDMAYSMIEGGFLKKTHQYLYKGKDVVSNKASSEEEKENEVTQQVPDDN